MFKLVIQDDEGKTTVVPLIRDEITIGRKEGNTIRLTERNVSRRHARILRNNGEVQIEDLGSYNGIRVNNARIAERVSLRVSDQVQIGDYKLYLKAEGVEQVDDARTMPIERIDNALPTEVMPAMGAPTTPMAAQAPSPIPGTPQPNRSPVAVADTDPAGRPIATAAQVAALSQPVGYGKLVVVSSNFAGKEFDLTRPQMIIGRTDENDLVINHRSISRNHAKITRDPEGGRYTISDLQSSNGVRVNGQDYGKVELRRGDTVDLGHVRLRFVEPGEDFVFSRDAVIADVPDAGGKRGLYLALAAAVLVVAIGGVYFAVSRGGSSSTAGTTKGDNGQGPGSTEVATKEPGPGSESTGPSNVQVPDNTDTTQTHVPNPPSNDPAATIALECQQLEVEKKWGDAARCAEKLAAVDAKQAKKLGARYAQELQNEITVKKIGEAVKDKDFNRAKKELAQVEGDSVYLEQAKKLVDSLEDDIVDLYRSSAASLRRQGKCDQIEKQVLSDARASGSAKAVAAVQREKCDKPPTGGGSEPKDCSDKLHENTKACKAQFCAGHKDDPKCGGTGGGGSGGTVAVTPSANCDAEALKDEGMTNVQMGQHAAALSRFEASLRCKRDQYVIQLCFMESCASRNSMKAKYYYKLLTAAQQSKFAQMCIREKVDYQ